MLKITLLNGQQFVNNPQLGINLESREEIEDCLNEVGYYELCTNEDGWHRIHKKDVKEIA